MHETTPAARPRSGPRSPRQRSDVRAAALSLFAERGYRSTGIRDIATALGIGPTSVYSHISAKAELLHEIVTGVLDALLAEQEQAIATSSDTVEQLRRVAETQVRYFARHPRESIVATRDFRWAEGSALAGILAGRQVYRHRIEELLQRGAAEGRFVVSNVKIAAFAIIEMCEAVPGWYRPEGELSETQVSYLYGEYAVRIAGVGPRPA
jgi:AcrR family transcriptional regulator